MLRGVCLGPCLEKWTVEYLGQKGGNKDVKIHVSTVPQMDFLHKNFAYKWALFLLTHQWFLFLCRSLIYVSYSQDFAFQWVCKKGVWGKTLWLLPVWGKLNKNSHCIVITLQFPTVDLACCVSQFSLVSQHAIYVIIYKHLIWYSYVLNVSLNNVFLQDVVLFLKN